MLISLTANADYEFPHETFLRLVIEPRLEGPTHRVTEEWLTTSPTTFARLDVDIYGNPMRRMMAAPGIFRFGFSATVEAEPNSVVPEDAAEIAARDLSAEALLFTLPSRYCPSDRLAHLAEYEFGALPPDGRRVRAIASWVHANTEYRYESTDALTGADEVVVQRAGVCRDFAHLVVSLCRALGIPARYVSGYCLGLEPPDFHAWAQVFLDGVWHNVDATSADLRPALIPIAWGRDAADVSLLTTSGPSICCAQTVSVERL
jgi:transglutaminase-like putative cysteine protease